MQDLICLPWIVKLPIGAIQNILSQKYLKITTTRNYERIIHIIKL